MKYIYFAVCLLFPLGIAQADYKPYSYTEAKQCLMEARKHARDPVLVLDIDDTALDVKAVLTPKLREKFQIGTSHYDKKATHYTRDETINFYKFVESYDQPAFPEMLKLYKFAKRNGIKIIFITARSNFMRHVTERNLANAGYKNHDGLYMNLDTSPLLKDCREYKSAVRQSLRMKGHDIIGNIGDKDHDLAGDVATCMFKMA